MPRRGAGRGLRAALGVFKRKSPPTERGLAALYGRFLERAKARDGQA